MQMRLPRLGPVIIIRVSQIKIYNPIILLIILFPLTPTFAGELLLTGKFTQGGLVKGSADGATLVTLDGRNISITPNGDFIFGFSVDAANEAILEVQYANGSKETKLLSIASRQWNIQRIDGLPNEMVTPPPETLSRIRGENIAIGNVRKRNTPEPWAWEIFKWPVKGRITGVFGSRRILNGQPRQPHFGIDIAAPMGTVVVAAASGLVALAERDMYFTGGTVILDHGYGLTSVYSHLSEVSVSVDEFVKVGTQIGMVGDTGRVTGPHLDWRINWFEIRLDPAFLVPPM